MITAGCLAVIVGLSSFGGGVAVAAGGGLAPPAVDPATIYYPTAAPDRVVLTPTSTPTTSQSVTWRTSTAVTAPKAEWALSGPSIVEGATSVAATSTTTFDSDKYPVSFHTATLEGLAPDTSYVYRVGDGETWSEWFEFRTASAEAEPFSFIVQGDAQNDNKAYSSRSFRAGFEARPYAQLAVHLGDLIDTETADAEWGEWNEAGALVNQYANVIATTGNHEYYPGPGLSQYWAAQFEFPQNGPDLAAHPETVYSVDYQGVRFISLNSNVQTTDGLQAQTSWLEGQLADNPNEWTVVTFHHPIFSASGDRNNQLIRDTWLPIVEQYDVDLVLSGHDHTYARGNLVANEQNLPEGADAQSSHTGPVYMVTVAGPKDYGLSPDGDNNWTQNGANRRVAATNQQMYQTVDVTDDGRMHVEARTVDGALFDAFTIVKDADGDKLVTTETEAWAGGPGSTREGVAAPGTDPSPEPTEEPSPEPTVEPTTEPTVEPTTEPTTEPTVQPTTEPTVEPTTEPTVEPTTEPTVEPTTGPSATPVPTASPEPSASASPALTIGQTTAAPGVSFAVNATGFAEHEPVTIELHSTPVVLARTSADAAGAVTATVTIPAGTAAGQHSIVVTGAESGRTVSMPITITAAQADARAALPATGGAIPISMMVLGGALALGGAALVARSVLRNRKAS